LRVFALLLLAVLAACPATAQESRRGDVLYQVSTLEALMTGIYDGQTTFAALAKHGDFGLGTFNALDGEMVALEGRFYQVRANGLISLAAPNQMTPFANVAFFRAQTRFIIENANDLAALQALLDKKLLSHNIFYAVRMTGLFSRVKVRSVPAQKPPYPPLTEVVKHQSVWNYNDLKGSIVGFRFPPYMQGLNTTGYHLHFLDQDRQKGGHLLDAAGAKLVVDVDALHRLDLALPRQGAFLKARLGQDTSQAVRKVEK
jgi:acetolactate decarboxylase